MRKTLLMVVCLSVLVSGCGPARGFIATVNRSRINDLELGMTKTEVQDIMGKPYKREAYEGVEYWLYYTEWQPDGFTTDDEFTPVAFVDGKVDGWGRNYYQKQKERIEADININQ